MTEIFLEEFEGTPSELINQAQDGLVTIIGADGARFVLTRESNYERLKSLDTRKSIPSAEMDSGLFDSMTQELDDYKRGLLGKKDGAKTDGENA